MAGPKKHGIAGQGLADVSVTLRVVLERSVVEWLLEQ